MLEVPAVVIVVVLENRVSNEKSKKSMGINEDIK